MQSQGTNTNPITGDKLQSKIGDQGSQDAYHSGWDVIFGDKNKKPACNNDNKEND